MPRKSAKDSAAPPPSLEEFNQSEHHAQFTENREIALTNLTLRRTLATREAELSAARQRLSTYEHPLLGSVEMLLSKHPSLTREQIAKHLKLTLSGAEQVLLDMAARGYNVAEGVLSRQGGGRRPVVEHFFGPEVRFGIVSDTHLGSRYALPECLAEAYGVFQREGITNVYCPGNLLDGEKTYRGQEYEIEVMGVDNVVANLARVWPRVEGITTHHVASSSCHEGYYLKSAGVLIGKLIEQARPDMPYLGLDEADIQMMDAEHKPVMRIVHPGGGTSYADSYRPQKIVESYSGAEKPDILVIGHHHKGGSYDIRDVQVVQAQCLQRQTPFMRKKSIRAVLGFWIVEARFTEDGSLRRFKTEAFKYYLGMGGKVLRKFTA